MTANGLHPRAFDSLVKKLRDRFGVIEPLPLDLKDQFVWSHLLWDASVADAERAFKKVMGSIVDLNELRVCLVEEIVATVGPRYPRVEERATRLRDGLHDIFLREHAVTFDHIRDMPKRNARAYLESLKGTNPFVTGRMLVLGLGAHAAPIDQRLLDRLADEEILDEGVSVEDASALLERHVKAANAVETHLLLLRWCEEAGPRKPARRPKSARAETSAAKSRKA